MTTPILKTRRLTLAPPFMHEGMDVSYYLKWLCNETVVKFSEQRHQPHTADSQYEYLCSFKGDDHIWEIQRDTLPIGSITARIDPNNRTANLGIMVGDRRVWGQGYGPEAWDAVCEWLFQNGTRKVEAGCMARNSPMIKVLDKCGFSLEATLPNYFLLDGKPEDMRYYGKYRSAQVYQIKERA